MRLFERRSLRTSNIWIGKGALTPQGPEQPRTSAGTPWKPQEAPTGPNKAQEAAGSLSSAQTTPMAQEASAAPKRPPGSPRGFSSSKNLLTPEIVKWIPFSYGFDMFSCGFHMFSSGIHRLFMGSIGFPMESKNPYGFNWLSTHIPKR